MDKEITGQHWRAFGLVAQEERGYKVASEIMGLSVNQVKILLRELREIEPDLFPIETEKHNLGKQIHKKERRDFNAGIFQIVDLGFVDGDIKMKF